MATIQIETTAGHKGGHWQSADGVVLRIHGACSAGGPGGWALGGWDRFVRGRHDGKMVEGPFAYAYGLAGVIAANPIERPDPIDVSPGDVLAVDGEHFAVLLDRRGYPHLDAIDAPDVRS